MSLPAEAEMLRIFIGEKDTFEGRPLSQAIVEEARRQGFAGATVLKGALGFGAHSILRTSHDNRQQLFLSQGLPIVIEMVEQTARIEKFLPTLDSMIGEGLVTREPVKVIIYRHSRPGGKTK